MANSATFWNLISKRYVASPVPDEDVYQRKIALTQARLRPDWHLLEIGCGSGNTALAHAPHVAHVTACDFSGSMLAHGRDRAQAEAIPNVTFLERSLNEIDTATQYDAVVMLSLIHLIPDWRSAIAKAAALTKTGGIFVSSTACIKDAPRPMRIFGSMMSAIPFLPSLSTFSADDLTREITKAGFEIEEFWAPTPSAAVFIIARRK